MKPMQWIAISLLGLLATGSFTPLPAVDEARQAYDKMVEESTKEADAYLQEKQKERKATEAGARSQQETALEKRVQAERQRIEAEMDTVRGRGLGPNFTQGMKDNLLKQLKDKLDQLASDPEAYFGGQ